MAAAGVALRAIALEERCGLWDIENAYLASDPSEEAPIHSLLGHSITYQIATGPREGQKAPDNFIARLAALVPKPRAHLTRYHGVLAPASPDRARIVPKTRDAAAYERGEASATDRQRALSLKRNASSAPSRQRVAGVRAVRGTGDPRHNHRPRRLLFATVRNLPDDTGSILIVLERPRRKAPRERRVDRRRAGNGGIAMLQEFLTLHRAELIERCKSKAALRSAPRDKAMSPNGVPLILDQLIETLRETLRAEHVTAVPSDTQICGRFGPSKARSLRTDKAASQHGVELLRNGFPIEEVVYGYGDLCQAVTDLAVERNATIQTHEFRTLNGCLDKAIADALISYSARPYIPLDADKLVKALHERLGFLAHEMRNHLQTATVALAAIRAGNVGSAGATAAVLDRSMVGMHDLINRSLTDVRTMAESPARRRMIAVADFIAEIQLSASLQAREHGCAFVVEPVDASLGICVDRELLLSALGNLLQNAFKFTRCHTQVALKTFAVGDRVLIEVEDSCGGLPAGDLEKMFRPFTQKGHDKSGVGLGLAICRRSVEANGGTLGVRDVPGSGCIFTIELPRHVSAKGAAEADS